jgi:hypothetical protein
LWGSLAGGFVFAAKQHFAAVQYGYKSENLRGERKKLIEDNQRLALEKRTSVSAVEASRQRGIWVCNRRRLVRSQRLNRRNRHPRTTTRGD